MRGPNRNGDEPQVLLKNMKLKRFQADLADSIDLNKDKGRIQSFLEMSYKKHYPIWKIKLENGDQKLHLKPISLK